VPALRARKLPAPRSDGRVVPWVNLIDAAAATVAAIDRGRPGQAYNIADDAPMGFGEHLIRVSEAFGAPRPRSVPIWLLLALPYAHAVMTTDMRVSTAKAQADLGWSPRFSTLDDGLAAMTGSRPASENGYR